MVKQEKVNGKPSREATRRGAALFAAGRYGEAAGVLEEAISSGEDAPGTRFLLAETLVMLDRVGGAVEHLRKTVPPTGVVPPSFYEVLKKILRRCEKPYESDAWRLAGEVSRRDSDRNLILGGLAIELGNTELGKFHLREAIKLDKGLVYAHLQLARILETEHKSEEAESTYLNAVRVAPQSLEAKYRLGEFYFGARRLEEAEKVLREAVGLDADALRERLLLGRVLEARGLVQEAQDVFLTAVRRVPTTSEGYRLLSEFCNQRGYASAAEELLRKAIVMETTTPRSYLQLADMLASRGKMDEAIKCLEDADRRRPGDPGVLFKMGWLYEQSGNREKMKEAFGRFLDAENASERHHRFLACIALERWDQAFEEAEIILNGWDETQEYHRLFRPWADHWLKPRPNAYYEDFERRLRFVSERIPENPWPVLYRGSFLVQLKKRDEAVSVLDSLSGFDEKRYGWMRFAGGVHKLNCGRFDEAVTDLEAVVRSRPRAWWARCRLAEAHLCMGRTKEAFEQFDAAEAGVGNRNILANVWGWRGEAMLWLGMYEDALTELNRAMSGGSWLALCWRGAALMQLTRHEEAFADLDKAITSGSRDAEAFVWRGELNRRLGKMTESLEDLNRAVELNGGAWANVNRAMTLSALGRRDEMVRDFKDVPAAILINALNEAGIDPRKELSDAEAVRGLETALRLAKGVRRYEDYLAPLWIKGIGPREACEAVQLDSPHLAFPDKISSGFVWRIG